MTEHNMKEYGEYSEVWACGCRRDFVEVEGSWELLDAEYCSFGERLFERHVQELYRPENVNWKRQRYVFKKLLAIHQARQEVTITV